MEITVRDASGAIVEGIHLGIDEAKDMSELFRRLEPVWYRTRRRMFESQGSATGEPWPGYLPRERRYVGFKGSALRRRINNSDQLRWEPGVQEMLAPSLMERSHPDSVYEVRPREASMGTRVPHADQHQEGGSRAPEWAGGYVLPRRPILALGGEYLAGVRVESVQWANERGEAIGRNIHDLIGQRIRGGGTL